MSTLATGVAPRPRPTLAAVRRAAWPAARAGLTTARESLRRGASDARSRSAAVDGAARGLGAVSGLGWVVVVTTVVALVVGAELGWVEAVALGVAGAALLGLAVGWAVGRSHYAVTVGLASAHVVVGESAAGRVEVTSTATRALRPARVELPVGDGLAAFDLPRLVPGQAHDELFVVPTVRRAVVVVGPVRSVRGDPLGLLRREKRWTEPVPLHVHPRTVPLVGTAAGFLRDLEGRPMAHLSDSDVAFHALREYQRGDDRRSVHWKTTARTGRIMVRQFEETRRSHLAVALSTSDADHGETRAADGTNPDFELAVSVTGSLALQALREERTLTVLTHDDGLRADSPRGVLDALCTVETGRRPSGVVELARAAADRAPGASMVVLVVGPETTPADLRRAQAQLPAGVRAVAVQCRTGSGPQRRAVGELTVLQLGALGDLGRGLRRVVG